MFFQKVYLLEFDCQVSLEYTVQSVFLHSQRAPCADRYFN